MLLLVNAAVAVAVAISLDVAAASVAQDSDDVAQLLIPDVAAVSMGKVAA